MNLSQNKIREFQDIWNKEFGEIILEDQAKEYCNNILELVQMSIIFQNNKVNKMKDK